MEQYTVQGQWHIPWYTDIFANLGIAREKLHVEASIDKMYRNILIFKAI